MTTARKAGDALRSLPLTADSTALRDRHCDFYRELASEIWAGEFTDDQELWAEVARAELDNLRVAFEWSLSRGNAEAALDLAAGPIRVWVSGRRREGRSWLQRALAATQTESTSRSHALLASLTIAISSGDVGEEEDLIEPLLASARVTGEDDVLFEAVFASTRRDLRSGDLEGAINGCHEATEIARRLASPVRAAKALIQWGWTEANKGQWEEGRRLFELAIAESEGESDVARGRIVLNYALYLHSAGELDASVPIYERACTLLRSGGELPGLQAAEQRAAEVLLDLGRTAEARTKLERVVAMGTAGEGEGDVGGALLALAEIALNAGDRIAGEGYAADACELLLGIEDRRFDAHLRLAMALVLRATLAELDGDPVGAVRWLERAVTEAMPGSTVAVRARRALGSYSLRIGDEAAARRHFQAALAEASGPGAPLAQIAIIESGLAVAAGEPRHAYDVLVEALTGADDQPVWQRAGLLRVATEAALECGRYVEAEAHAAEVLASSSASPAKAAALLHRAFAQLGLGDASAAASHLVAIGSRWGELWQPSLRLAHVRAWARLRVALGDHERGVELLALAERERQRLHYVDPERVRNDSEAAAAQAKSELGDDAFARAWACGSRLDVREELAREAAGSGT